MKLNDLELFLKKSKTWHTWFAWYPVIANYAGNYPEIIWLQKVDRKLCETGGWDSDTYWKYKAIAS